MRYYILLSTTKAGSGHLTSSLSAVELIAVLFFKYFRFDLNDPDFIENDRLIFSKGHASPLFYSLYAAAGKISKEELLGFRTFGSVLEGHPTNRFKYTEVPTGSLGQGLSAGVGMALSAKMDELDYLTYVLLGDGEMAEGQVWEALELASYYKLNNLIGIVDVNRLGQTGETLLGHDLEALENRIKSFGWRTYVINDGHNLEEIDKAYRFIISELPKADTPYMILAKTIKGKGVSFLEDKEGWHGRILDKNQLKTALDELGKVNKSIKVEIEKPANVSSIMYQVSKIKKTKPSIIHNTSFTIHDSVAAREAYGKALVDLGKLYEDVVVMDCDVSNSTFSCKFKEAFPDRFYEMFIAEQNMISVALGLSERGKVPYVSTFASFLTRACDQIRMAKLSGNHIVICGSHSGVSIGEDGPSQMGLEDLAIMRTGFNTTIFYPSDAVSTESLTHLAYGLDGIVYIRTTRPETPVIYSADEKFQAGGSKTLKETANDRVTVIAAGITVHETLKAYETLNKQGVNIRVIDAYSIKPIDANAILKAAEETQIIITVEDHYLEGGMGDAVLEVLAGGRSVKMYKMGIKKMPKSGKQRELLDYEEISAESIVEKVRSLI